MRWSDIPRDPSPRILRQFAGLCLVIFGGLAAWRGWARGASWDVLVLAALALVIGGVGLAAPRLVRPVFVGWMVLAFPIGWTVSNVVLAVLYYGLITPVGLVFRLAGRDALALRRPRGAASYWQPKAAPADVRRYFRQF